MVQVRVPAPAIGARTGTVVSCYFPLVGSPTAASLANVTETAPSSSNDVVVAPPLPGRYEMLSMEMPPGPPAAVSPEKVTDLKFVNVPGSVHCPKPVVGIGQVATTVPPVAKLPTTRTVVAFGNPPAAAAASSL